MLDLRAQANCDTGQGSDSVPGWVDEAKNYLIDFPTGGQRFRGVPFEIASSQDNGHRVCIGVSSAPRYSARTAGSRASILPPASTCCTPAQAKSQLSAS
jgi:hypothetical protein